jgi:hypothetical protein
MAVDPSTALSAAKAGTTAFTTITNALGIKTLQASMEEALEEDAWEFVNEAATHVHQVMNSWEGVPEDERPKPAEIGAILHEAVKAARGAVNGKKRRLLRNAVVNAFSRQAYEDGFARRLFRILDELEYGDVHVLQELAKIEEDSRIHLTTFAGAQGSERRHHIGILATHGLVVVRANTTGTPGSVDAAQGFVRASEFGRRLLKFVGEPEPSKNS